MANPVMNAEDIQELENPSGEIMTLQGTINSSMILVGLTIVSAIGVWQYAALFMPFLLPLIIV